MTTYGHPIVGPGGLVLTSASPPGIDINHDLNGAPAWSSAISAGTGGEVFDASGELYFYTAGVNPAEIEAVGPTGVRWTKAFNADSIALGFNGDLYAVVAGQQLQLELVELDLQTGDVVFEELLPSPFSDFGTELEAYNGGLIAFDGTYLAYLNYNGAVTASFAVPNLPSGSQIAAWGIDGSVYFVEGIGCGGDENPGVTLEKYLPSGPSWSYNWPSAIDCPSVPTSVAALPNGSAAINIGLDGATSDGVTVVGQGANAGTASVRWSINLGEDRFEFAGIHQVLADTSGDITAEFDFLDKQGTSACPFNDPCVDYEVDLLNGASGTVSSTADLYTDATETYALGTDFDLDTDLVILGAASGAQLTMFGLTLAGVGPAYPESDRPTVGTQGTDPTSPNWAGYVSLSPPDDPVSAEITIPTVTCNRVGAMSMWVGFDGWPPTNTTVEQDGIGADCERIGTAPTLYTWYELFNKTKSVLDLFSNTHNILVNTGARLEPGDKVDLFVERISHPGRTFTNPLGRDQILFSIYVDSPTGQQLGHWSKSIAEPIGFNPKYSSAECITERTKGPLVTFSPVDFSDCSAISQATSASNLIQVNMIGNTSDELAATGSESASNFSVTWLASS